MSSDPEATTTVSSATGSKPKPSWLPNEAPTSRWVLFFALTVFLGFGAQIPLSVVLALWKISGDWYWLPETLCTLGAFSCSYAVTAWLAKKVLATSVRELILGPGGPMDRKLCVRLGLAWVVGFLLTLIVDNLLGNGAQVELNPVGAVPVLVNFLICSALLWMQTTWEEILYRCTFLRATCGNNIRPTLKCILWGILATAAFMSGHFFNSEVTTQTDVASLVMSCLSYFVSGMGMYLADVFYGSCLPGCVIHWCNNFFLFTVWVQAGSTGESAGILYVHSGMGGAGLLIDDLILYVPIIAMVAYDWTKARRAGGKAAVPEA